MKTIFCILDFGI